MPIHADDVETLHDFTIGFMARGQHQASTVRGIALAVLGGIIWRVDPGSIQIRSSADKLANALRWISVSGREYVCTYNHHTDQLEIHDQSRAGAALHRFTNETPVTDIERIFSTL
jgi:hypothetical protein